mmetsp:Transcript_13289/g.30588  ORF Transcript_13289/g.30588 Transcript_13289/m.30588 type:complete len:211 (+) Transcript_13289:254-886(+)
MLKLPSSSKTAQMTLRFSRRASIFSMLALIPKVLVSPRTTSSNSSDPVLSSSKCSNHACLSFLMSGMTSSFCLRTFSLTNTRRPREGWRNSSFVMSLFRSRSHSRKYFPSCSSSMTGSTLSWARRTALISAWESERSPLTSTTLNQSSGLPSTSGTGTTDSKLALQRGQCFPPRDCSRSCCAHLRWKKCGQVLLPDRSANTPDCSLHISS